MDLETAIEHALLGEAVLFYGAGFSKGAINVRGEFFKTGRELAKHLSRAVGLPDDTQLEDASEEYSKRLGEDQLIEELKLEFMTKTISSEHETLAKIAWRRVYTTNYDNVFETALTANSKLYTAVTLQDNIRKIPKNNLLCIHLNGYIDRLTRDSLWSEFKLTDSSFLTALVASSDWAHLFRQDLRSARAIFFIGYSLEDIDIKRLIFETVDLKGKCFFILGGNPDAATQRRASRFGETLLMDTAEFASAVEQISNRFVPPEVTEFPNYCLEKLTVPLEYGEFSDQLEFDLLLLGETNPSHVWQSLHEGPLYLLKRSAANEVLSKIENGHPVVVHSELANGKTLLVEAVKWRALEKGYEVYSLVNRTEDLEQEMEWVLRAKPRALIVVEDYPDWLDAVKHFAVHASSKQALLLSARSLANDVNIDRLYEILQRDDIPEVSVDRLTDEDIAWLADFFDKYGLWAERAAWSRTRKIRFLSRDCAGEFSIILIRLLESPQIATRYQAILQQLNNQREYYEIVITILALAVLHFPATIDTLMDIWGDRVLESGFQRNPVVRQLLDFPRGQVRLRSAGAARFILKRVAGINFAIEALITMAKATDKHRQMSLTYHNLLKSLMRFSDLQQLLPEKQKLPTIISYYEKMKNLEGARGNPLFWLQYAIACLFYHQFDRAEKYFATAYSYAEDRGWDTYQIDNHYARFLLITAIEANDPANCMKAFRKARNIINRQISEPGRYYYPFRVADTYLDFFQTYAPHLSSEDIDEIVRAAAFVAKRIEALPEQRQHQQHVEKCYTSMKLILSSSGLDT